MKNLLRLEEFAQFLACLYFLISTDQAWWTYVLLLIGPDVSMLGYLAGSQVGAIAYNLFHYKGIATMILFCGLILMTGWITTLGLILFGHASMDRIFGYGLKFGDNFHHTHLGWIGKGKSAGSVESGVC